MNIRQYADHERSVRRGRVFVSSSLVLVVVLGWTANSPAQGDQRRQASDPSIPTLEALPHHRLPRGKFMDWCGQNDKLILEIDQKAEIYSGGVKASPLSFPLRSRLQCDDAGQKMAFVDEESGYVSEVDISAGVVTRTLATYDKENTQGIAFSPDLNHVASSKPLALGPSALDLNVIALRGAEWRDINFVHWSGDSSRLFGVSAPEGKGNHGVVEIVSAQRRRLGSGALPPGFLFRDGWFANSQSLYLYLVRASDEFGSGLIFKCAIEKWKCDRIADNVLDASAGGDGILAMVRAVGRYSNDGETVSFPPSYLAEIRNGASQVVARQTFKAAERRSFGIAVAPSGMKAILTWWERVGPECPPEERATSSCPAGIEIDLQGRSK
jgi:hypothetical protein